jgi:regulator of replication initiation timing
MNQSELSKQELKVRKLEEQLKTLKEQKEEVLRENDTLKESLEHLKNMNYEI